MVSAIATRTLDCNQRQRRRLSPLTRRILALNVLALAILVGGVMYLGRYQDRLIQDELEALNTEARIFGGALGVGAVVDVPGAGLRLAPDLARLMVRGLAEPTETRTRLFDAAGTLIGDSQGPEAPGVAPLPPDPSPGWLVDRLGRFYDTIAHAFPSRDQLPVFRESPLLQANLATDLQQALAGEASAIAWTTPEGGLTLTAAVPVKHDTVLGALLLTQNGNRIEAAVQSVRLDILHVFAVTLTVTVALSLYLASSIVRPIRLLAQAADQVRRGHGRHQEIPDFTNRHDEIGELSLALREMTSALWARMDAIEHFAADVSHELKNPLSSLRSAVETAARIHDIERQRPLMAIIEDDVRRLDRLISDISHASRIDAELSRAETEAVDVGAILRMLADIHTATTAGEADQAPRLEARLPTGVDLTVRGFEGRLVQVFQNLIANALSFSAPGGVVTLAARRDGQAVEITVTDHGPGIPEGKLEAIFDRFYSERPPTEKFGTHSGLGLSISKQIVEAHHGTIVARNRLAPDGSVTGAVFTVRLPLRA